MKFFLLKLVLCPLGVFLGDLMLTDVAFPSLALVIIVGVALAVVGRLLEAIMLRPGTLWLSTVADWAASAAIVYISQFLIAGAYVSVVGALLTGGIIAIFEYVLHRMILTRDSFAFR